MKFELGAGDMQPPAISIVIVSWNTCDLLRECLTSVFAEPTGLQLQVLVGDNGSTDGSIEKVRAEFPHVILVENTENLGFAAANNRLFPLCRAELIMLLNSDTVVKGDALRVLTNFLAAHPKAGCVAPKLLHPQARLSVLGCGHQATLRTTFNHYLFLARLFPHVRAFEGTHLYVGKHDDKPRSVGWVSGACMVVRKSVINQAGPLTEQWFMYAEDQEWCARIHAAGWDIVHVPAAVVEHHLGASATDKSETAHITYRASRELFIQQNKPSALQLLAFDATRGTGLAIRAVGSFVRSLVDRPRRELWRRRARRFAINAAIAAWGVRRPRLH